jgi:hypothetical protein
LKKKSKVNTLTKKKKNIALNENIQSKKIKEIEKKKKRRK